MYNILVVDNNLKRIQSIVNILSCINSVRVSNIISNYDSAKQIIMLEKVDIIILLNNFYKLKNFIFQNKIYKYKQSIITLSSNNFKTSLFISIKRIVKLKDNLEQIKEKIKDELKYLNYNFSYIGTKYLEELILELYKTKDSFEGNFKTTLYPILSKKYNKSIDIIYRKHQESY